MTCGVVAIRLFHLAGSGLVFVWLLHISLVRLGQFLLLRTGTGTGKDIEIIALRHQHVGLRRQADPLRPSPANRALLAILSRLLSKIR